MCDTVAVHAPCVSHMATDGQHATAAPPGICMLCPHPSHLHPLLPSVALQSLLAAAGLQTPHRNPPASAASANAAAAPSPTGTCEEATAACANVRMQRVDPSQQLLAAPGLLLLLTLLHVLLSATPVAAARSALSKARCLKQPWWFGRYPAHHNTQKRTPLLLACLYPATCAKRGAGLGPPTHIDQGTVVSGQCNPPSLYSCWFVRTIP